MGIKKQRVKKVAQNFMRKKLSTIATFSMDPHRSALFNGHIEFLQTMKRELQKPLKKTKIVCYKCVFVTLWEKLRKWEVENNSRGLEGAPGGPADQGINPGEIDKSASANGCRGRKVQKRMHT